MDWSAFRNGFFKGLAAPCALVGMFSPEYGRGQAAPPSLDLDAILSGKLLLEDAPFVHPESRGGLADDMAAEYGDFVRSLERMR